MIKLSLGQIKIAPDRQRKEFSEEGIEELANSIRDNGLINPITVRAEGKEHFLVAGERRLRAITLLLEKNAMFFYGGKPCSKNGIECNLYTDLNAAQAEEIELEENIRRIDLTWQEQTNAKARLHALRVKQAEDAGKPVHTLTDSAREVYPTQVSSPATTKMKDDVNLAAAMAVDPEIAKSDSKRAALKRMSDKYVIEFASELVRREKEGGGDPATRKYNFYNEDCLVGLNESEKMYDCFLIDPPYGIDADTHKNYNSTLSHGYEDGEGSQTLIQNVVYEALMHSKLEAHIYLWCGADIDSLTNTLDSIRLAVEGVKQTNVTIWKWPLIWNKMRHTLVPDINCGPARAYETCIFINIGKKPFGNLHRDVLDFPSGQNKIHAAEKPIELEEALLKRSCIYGDEVCIPFAGSGNAIKAALNLGMIPTAYELDPEMYAKAKALL